VCLAHALQSSAVADLSGVGAGCILKQAKILHENALFLHKNFIAPSPDLISYPSAPLFKISGSATGLLLPVNARVKLQYRIFNCDAQCTCMLYTLVSCVTAFHIFLFNLIKCEQNM